MAKGKRRVGKGSITSYRTVRGTRWRWQLRAPIDVDNPDAGVRQMGNGGFLSAAEADDALTEAKRSLAAGLMMARQTPTIASYLDNWLDSLDLEPSTVAGYRRLGRNHVTPYLGNVPLDKLTATRISRHYKELREHGRKDKKDEGGPLSANTVQKVHVLLGAMLDAAKDDGLLSVNPARKAKIVKAPTGKQIRAQKPEMVTWTAAELTAFLTWSRVTYNDHLYALWHVIAYTGMRRSEALALKFEDIDFAHGRISVRRALDTTQRGQLKVTKTNRPRVVDIDTATVDVLKSYRKQRGAVALTLAHGDAFVFSTLTGETRQPKAITKAFGIRVRLAEESLRESAKAASTPPDGSTAPEVGASGPTADERTPARTTATKAAGRPVLRHMTLTGLRHTHATLLLAAGEHPKVVQERLGHTTITTTMDVYSHVTPTMQRSAADRFAAMLT